MKILSSLFLFTFFMSGHAVACQKTTMSYDEIALASQAVYVGGVMGVSIPELTADKMNEDLSYPNAIQRSDRVVTLKVFQTLNGEAKESIDVTLDWCDGKEAKLGKMAILYKLDGGWYLKHDEFAISETVAILSTRSKTNLHRVALK